MIRSGLIKQIFTYIGSNIYYAVDEQVSSTIAWLAKDEVQETPNGVIGLDRFHNVLFQRVQQIINESFGEWG